VPELPEVETVVRDLRPRLVGRRFRHVEGSSQPLRTEVSWDRLGLVLGHCVEDVRRRGKWIVVCVAREIYLVIHLGMTGQLVITQGEAPQLPHTHLIFSFHQSTEQLRFRDIRRFGSARVFDSPEELEQFFKKTGLGPEPFDLDPKYWRERLAATSRNLKAILLDQCIVAGVGNIYADESLFVARLHPARRGRDLSAVEARRLREAIATVLTRAIEKRGSSIRNYVGGSGLKGEYQHEFLVYGRKGQPCVRCGRAIERIVLAGRSTHFCPRCQKRKDEG